MFNKRIIHSLKKNVKGYSVKKTADCKIDPANLNHLSSSTQSNTAKTSRKPTQSDIQYCIDIVKKYDHEGFLSTLLVPDARTRRCLFAVRAFNAEVATIRENITFKETGLGRLFFWKDSVEQLYSGKPANKLPRHPVIQELATEVVTTGALSKRWFMNLVESREETMTDTPFKTMAELEKYSDKSVSPIFFITFDFLGLKTNHLDHAASHFGKSIGITNFIRSLPYSSKKRRVLVPQDLMIKHNMSQENFIRLDEPVKMQALVYDMACQAVAHYEHGKNLKENFMSEISKLKITTSPESVFLAALPSKFYLERLQKRNFNPFDPKLTRRYGLLPWLLYYNKLRKRYFY